MQEMLCALNHRRSARLLGDVHETLDTKESCAKVLGDPIQQELCFLARQRTVAREHKILDTSFLEMMTVRMARVIMFVMIIIVAARIMIMGAVLMRLDIEPWPGIRPWVGGIETRRCEQFGDCN